MLHLFLQNSCGLLQQRFPLVVLSLFTHPAIPCYCSLFLLHEYSQGKSFPTFSSCSAQLPKPTTRPVSNYCFISSWRNLEEFAPLVLEEKVVAPEVVKLLLRKSCMSSPFRMTAVFRRTAWLTLCFIFDPAASCSPLAWMFQSNFYLFDNQNRLSSKPSSNTVRHSRW